MGNGDVDVDDDDDDNDDDDEIKNTREQHKPCLQQCHLKIFNGSNA